MCAYIPLCRDFQNSLTIYTQATKTDSSTCISISKQIYIYDICKYHMWGAYIFIYVYQEAICNWYLLRKRQLKMLINFKFSSISLKVGDYFNCHYNIKIIHILIIVH